MGDVGSENETNLGFSRILRQRRDLFLNRLSLFEDEMDRLRE